MFKNQLLFITGLVFAVTVTIFALANASPVEINLVFMKFVSSQALIIFLSAAFGAIIVASLGLIKHFKLRYEVKILRKDNAVLTNKNKELQELLPESNKETSSVIPSDKDGSKIDQKCS